MSLVFRLVWLKLDKLIILAQCCIPVQYIKSFDCLNVETKKLRNFKNILKSVTAIPHFYVAVDESPIIDIST